MLIAINYHYIRPSFDTPYDGFYGLTPDHFRRQLQELQQIGGFISGSELRYCVQENTECPQNKNWIITFDDGLKDHYKWVIPILSEMDIPAIFFINTAPIYNKTIETVHKIHLLMAHVSLENLETFVFDRVDELGLAIDLDQEEAAEQNKYDTSRRQRLKHFLNDKLDRKYCNQLTNELFSHFFDKSEAEVSKEIYLAPEEVNEIAKKFTVGTHSHNHVPLNNLGTLEKRNQLQTSLQRLREWTDEEIYSLSYPFGWKKACDPDAADLANSMGIDFAFTMERAVNQDFENPLFLARCDTNDVPGGKNPKWGKNIFQEISKSQWYRGSL